MAAPEYSVKVSNLPTGTNSTELKHALEAQGFVSITDCYLPEKFLRQGFGFVRFSSQEEANRATQDDGFYCGSARLSCEVALTERRKRADDPAIMWQGGGKGLDQGPGPVHTASMSPSGEHSVWVGSLPTGVTQEQLSAAFVAQGVSNMTDVYIPHNKGFGFVRFSSYDEASDALDQCQGLSMGDRLLELKLSSGKQRSVPQGRGMQEAPLRGYEGDGCQSTAWQSSVQPGGGCSGSRSGAHVWGYGSNGAPPPGYAPIGKGPDAIRDAFNHGFEMALAKGAKGGMAIQSQVPSTERSLEHSVWVGSLPPGASRDELAEAFWAHGVSAMTDVYVPPGRDYGFVRFANWEGASAAMHSCAGLTIRGNVAEMKLSTSEKLKGGTLVPPASAMVGQPPPTMLPMVPPVVGHPPPLGGHRQVVESTARSKTEVSVKVGNLAPGTTSDDLWGAFGAEGVTEMSDVYVPNNKSFGFLRFPKLSFAQDAMRCAGVVVRGAQVSLELAAGDKRSSTEMAWSASHGMPAAGAKPDLAQAGDHEVSIKCGNLPPDCSPEDIREAFAEQGIDTMTDCYIPQGRPFGFVRFASTTEGRIVLHRSIHVHGNLLLLEPAVNTKRTSAEMAVAWGSQAPPPKMPRTSSLQELPSQTPMDPNVSADAPSVKVSMVPPGTAAEELRRSLVAAGCMGQIIDVYVPKGDRGFAFVRFNTQQDAYEAAELKATLRGIPLGLDIAVQERRIRR